MVFPPHGLLKANSKEEARELRHACINTPWIVNTFANEKGHVYLVIQSFIIVTPDNKKIIVDTCAGNERDRESAAFNMLSTNYLKTLKHVDCSPETISHVMCTHLHVDHVGWNTMKDPDTGTFIPTFPNAKYLFNKEEFNHWQEIVASGGGSQSTTDQAIMGECVQPIVDSNLHELIDSSYIIANEGDKCCIYLISTPGHTPGHCSVVIESNGARGVITGDCIHHPLQIQKTSRPSNFDTDEAAGAQTRKTLLGSLAGTNTILFGTHFAKPSCGLVKKDFGKEGGEFIFDIGANHGKM